MLMSKTIELSDEQYQAIERLAASRGQTADALVRRFVEDLATHADNSVDFETEGWFRHLGATNEQIAEAKRIVRKRTASHVADA
jgi:predicted transcriptional regulator